MAGSGAGTGRAIRAALLAAALAAAACSPIFRNHGYTPSDAQLAEIVVGIDTRDTIEEVVGRPSTVGVIEDRAWYYVSGRQRVSGIREPEFVERQLVAITFDARGVVTGIERFGLEQGRVVPLSRRTTESTVGDTTFIRQLLGNFGRLQASDFLE